MEFKKGQTLEAQMLNALVQLIPQVLQGGYGINVKRVGNKVIIEDTTRQIIPKT